MAAQAVEAELDGAQPYPIAPAEDATAPGDGVVARRDSKTYGRSELDPIRTRIEVDQNRKCMRRARLRAHRLCDGFGRLARHALRHRSGVDADGRANLG